MTIWERSVNFIISGSEFRCFNQTSYQQFFSEANKLQNVNNIWCYYSKTKTEDCDRRNLYFCVDFGMLMSWATSYFLEVSVHDSFKVATKGYLRDKNTLKFRVLGCSSKAKTVECNQKIWNIFDQFRINFSIAQVHIFWE